MREIWSAWAWNARGCWPTTSSWISGRQSSRNKPAKPLQAVETLAAQETDGREALAALDDSLKTLRIEAQASQETALRNRTGAGRKASRAEVSGRNQPQRTECGSAGDAEIAAEVQPLGRRSRPGRQCRRIRAALSGSPRADRGAGPGESAGARRISGSPAAL